MSAAAATLSPQFKARRVQNWMVIGFLYSFFYMSRYNLAAISPELMKFFGWTKVDFGLFETVLPLVYGLSVVINGPVADRIGGRKAFLIGAVGVTIASALMGLTHLLVQIPAVVTGEGHAVTIGTPAVLAFGLSKQALLWGMAILWGVNGYFQSFGALSIVKINAQWFHTSERGRFAAVFGVLIRFGLVLAFSGAPIIATYLPWHWAFWIPGAVVGALFVATLFWVKDTPAEAGLGEYDTGEGPMDPNQKVALGEILKKVFSSRVMWMIALASMMIGVVRRSGIDGWFRVYFDNVHNVNGQALAFQLAAWGIALGGITGGFVMGWMSDTTYGGRRAPVVVLGFVGMTCAMLLFWLSDFLNLGPYSAALILTLTSFFVNGAHGMIGGAASMDFGGRKAAATAAGLFDGMQYLAASFVGVTVGWITTNHGWQWWKVWPLPFAIVGALVMSRLWNTVPKKGGGH
jgi:OPA family glycerol-3-phosphate transporter-like MFS transporter